MAGIIGLGLKSEESGSPGDFNAKVGVGSYYYWGGTVTNSPDGQNIAFGFRVVLYSHNNGGVELYYSLNNRNLYFRAGATLSSTAWKTITLS